MCLTCLSLQKDINNLKVTLKCWSSLKHKCQINHTLFLITVLKAINDNMQVQHITFLTDKVGQELVLVMRNK